MWTIVFDGTPSSFQTYRTRAEARYLARLWRSLWPTHTYTVAREQPR